MIVDVHCDDGTTQIARIVLESGDTYTVNFLEKNKYRLYDFVNINEVIDKGSISGFYDTDELEKTQLYMKNINGYELIDDSEDENYTASEIESNSEDDVSLVDEDGDEDEDEDEET
mgnify:CR=1 FL=1|jgi:hypothetical protein|tara:strand:- start:1195 stop:1542 length:348 start_codon:yes stop_codon:yes gene_type:complete